MLSKEARGKTSNVIHNRTNIVVPKTADEIARETSHKLEGVVIPNHTPKDAIRKLRICLSADLPIFVLRHQDVDHIYFKKSSDTEYVFSERMEKELGDSSTLKSVPKETLRLLVETVCSNLKTPIWVEGFQMEKVYYLMVLRNLDNDLFNAVTQPQGIKKTVNLSKGGHAVLEEHNKMARLETKAIGVVAKSAVVESTLDSVIKKIGEHLSACRDTIRLVKTMEESKDVEVQRLLAQVNGILEAVASGKMYLSARDYSKSAAILSGLTEADFEAKVTQSPFASVEAKQSAVEAARKVLQESQANPMAPTKVTLTLKPGKIEVDPRMKDRESGSERLGNIDPELKKILDRISAARAKNQQLSEAEVSMAMDLGWEFNKQSRGFSHPRFVGSPIVRAMLNEFFKTGTWSQLQSTLEPKKRHPPTMSFNMKESKMLEEKIFEEETADTHKMTYKEATNRFMAIITNAFTADIDKLCDGISNEDIMIVWTICRKQTGLFCPPTEEIVQEVFRLISGRKLQMMISSDTYVFAKKTVRVEVSDDHARKMTENLIASRVKHCFEKGNIDKFISSLVGITIGCMTSFAYCRRTKGYTAFGNQQSASIVTSVLQKMKSLKAQGTFTLMDYERLVELGETLTFESDGSLNKQELLGHAIAIETAILQFSKGNLSDVVSSMKQPAAFGIGTAAGYVAAVSALPLISQLFGSDISYGYPTTIAHPHFLAAHILLSLKLQKCFSDFADDLLFQSRSQGQMTLSQTQSDIFDLIKYCLMCLGNDIETKGVLEVLTKDAVGQKKVADLSVHVTAAVALQYASSKDLTKTLSYVLQNDLVPARTAAVFECLDPGKYLMGGINIRGVIPRGVPTPTGLFPANTLCLKPYKIPSITVKDLEARIK